MMGGLSDDLLVSLSMNYNNSGSSQKELIDNLKSMSSSFLCLRCALLTLLCLAREHTGPLGSHRVGYARRRPARLHFGAQPVRRQAARHRLRRHYQQPAHARCGAGGHSRVADARRTGLGHWVGLRVCDHSDGAMRERRRWGRHQRRNGDRYRAQRRAGGAERGQHQAQSRPTVHEPTHQLCGG
jgi:hypothetical protein